MLQRFTDSSPNMNGPNESQMRAPWEKLVLTTAHGQCLLRAKPSIRVHSMPTEDLLLKPRDANIDGYRHQTAGDLGTEVTQHSSMILTLSRS